MAILDRPAAEVLPRLLLLGSTGRVVWVLYALVPLLLIPTAIGVDAAAGEAAPRITCAVVNGTPDVRDAIAVVFAAANSYLGNYIGELLGELFLNTFFLCASIALVRAGGWSRRWLLYAGSAATLMGALPMLRNVTPAVGPIASVNNTMLPVWMLVLGAALVTHGRRRAV